jgi:GntR family transcriptional regulator
LQKEIVAPKSSILESLGLDENSQTVKIVRLRYVNDEPMVIETSYFPLDYAFLLQENLDGSLFQVLREKKDLVIDGSKKIVEICRATTEEARWLKLRKNAPLLLVRSVAFGNAGQPVYVCMQVINGERFQLIL